MGKDMADNAKAKQVGKIEINIYEDGGFEVGATTGNVYAVVKLLNKAAIVMTDKAEEMLQTIVKEHVKEYEARIILPSGLGTMGRGANKLGGLIN